MVYISVFRGGEINRPCRPVADPDDCIMHYWILFTTYRTS